MRNAALASALYAFAGFSFAQENSRPYTVYRCAVDGVVHYMARPIQNADCRAVSVQPAPQHLLAGPPSILSQCLDAPQGSMLVGPSARARECTRQYCSQPSYKTIVSAYAMSKPQSDEDQQVALTCITRAEQDMKR